MVKRDGSGYILEVRSVQSSAIKILIEGLKELLTECCINFDDTGIKIVSMDSAHVVLVHLKLEAKNFELYYLNSNYRHDNSDKSLRDNEHSGGNSNRLTIGVNMINFFKLIRTINSNDTLTLFLEANDLNHLGIRIENGEKNTKTTYRLDLLDLDDPKVTVDPAEFNTVITLPSTDFQKIMRDMNNITDKIEIKNITNQLILSCKGDFCHQETVLADSDNGVNRIDNRGKDEIVQGVFSSKYLVLFTKCTNLCNTVELFLKNDYPKGNLTQDGMKSTVPVLISV